MYINEYGSRDDPTVILLAPMMVSGSDLYNLMKPEEEAGKDACGSLAVPGEDVRI